MRSIRYLLLFAAVAMFVPVAPTAAARRAPRRFRTYTQLARSLRRREYRDAFEVLDSRVGAALGVADVASAGVLPVAAAMADAVGAAYSETNVQVAGVDEGDLVKTDGDVIYAISRNRLAVIRALGDADDSGTPAGLELLALKQLDVPGFHASELYLHGNLLVVVGMAYDFHWILPPIDPIILDGVVLNGDGTKMMWYVQPMSRTVALVFDVSEPEQTTQIRRIELEGSFLASRRIGDTLYLLARAYPSLEAVAETSRRNAGPGLVPRVSDSLDGGDFEDLPARAVYRLLDSFEAAYLVIGVLDLSDPAGAFGTQAFLGAGNTVYASKDSLYVASSSWYWRPILMAEPGTPDGVNRESTTVYRFALNGMEVTFVGAGEVPGRVLNSFSMDEHEGVFRIATTSHANFWTEEVSSNAIYALDAELKPLGQITGLAPGERIYAARFLGPRCYLVTFEQIDPLFVIGLDDPSAPEVLGELKIPGYSSYLHPVDATHLIGFGKDVTLVETYWAPDGTPYEQGLKLSLFDVADAAHPLELDTEIIGVRGSYSEALYNHHAFLYAPERRYLAFPCTVREYLDGTAPPEPWQMGDFVFQGVLAYSVTPEGRFEKLGGVTHIEDYTSLLWDAPPGRSVQRALLIGDVLHTLSESRVMASTADTLEELDAVEIPAPPEDDPPPIHYWLMVDAVPEAGAGAGAGAGSEGDVDGAFGTAQAAGTALGSWLRQFIEAR
ncbi:MAG: beta-propeller domain-containing protein [Lentisphaeria bacterium]|nr:beta-propeller domain-containing protein [Lentisphaeria bacterium]